MYSLCTFSIFSVHLPFCCFPSFLSFPILRPPVLIKSSVCPAFRNPYAFLFALPSALLRVFGWHTNRCPDADLQMKVIQHSILLCSPRPRKNRRPMLKLSCVIEFKLRSERRQMRCDQRCDAANLVIDDVPTVSMVFVVPCGVVCVILRFVVSSQLILR